jgi:hypothetical protein
MMMMMMMMMRHTIQAMQHQENRTWIANPESHEILPTDLTSPP